MAKFYITSGDIREIVVSNDAEGAALEALDRFFEPLRWVFGCSTLSECDRRSYFACEALLRLDARVRVSQSGFGDGASSGKEQHPLKKGKCHERASVSDVGCEVYFGTADLVDTHYRLTRAMAVFVEIFGVSSDDTDYLTSLYDMDLYEQSVSQDFLCACDRS